MILIMMICGISYAAPKPVKINKKQLLGTWFWNFGYNQEKFSRDEITFNKDQTFEIFSINQIIQNMIRESILSSRMKNMVLPLC